MWTKKLISKQLFVNSSRPGSQSKVIDLLFFQQIYNYVTVRQTNMDVNEKSHVLTRLLVLVNDVFGVTVLGAGSDL